MSKEFYTAPGRFIESQAKIKAWCREQFGPELKVRLASKPRNFKSNHGNWAYNNGKVSFRHKKDLTAFLLWASAKEDVEGNLYLDLIKYLSKIRPIGTVK